MIRVTTFEMDGISLKIASMSVNEAEAFVESGNALLAKMKAGEEVNPKIWLQRRNDCILASLNKVPQENKWTEARLKDELDLPTLAALHDKILEFSGLKTGEATAAAE